jgi:proline dehydrogenase
MPDGSGLQGQVPPIARALRAGFHALVRRASRNYIAGPALEDAQRVARDLSARGYWVTLGYWDSAADSADQVLQMYQASALALADLPGDNYLSIKLPALQYDAARFRQLAEACRGHHTGLLLDALETDQAEPTLEFLDREGPRTPVPLGCALPGRWGRSLADAERAIGLGLAVRVVKGQSPDPSAPHHDPQAGYLDVIRVLAGRARLVRVASHNPGLARAALEMLARAGTRCELELLFGLPVGPQINLAREFGVPVRVYVAFGHAFLPYALSSLRKNPGAILRLLRETTRSRGIAAFPTFRASPPVARPP